MKQLLPQLLFQCFDLILQLKHVMLIWIQWLLTTFYLLLFSFSFFIDYSLNWKIRKLRFRFIVKLKLKKKKTYLLIFCFWASKLRISNRETLNNSNQFCHLILFYHSKKLLYQLYNTILQYTQHPNFYFYLQYIKII